jgi:hypothetical protein
MNGNLSPTDEERPAPSSELSSAEASAPAEMSWANAIVRGLAVLVIGFVGVVFVPNRILTKALGLTRTAREWIALAVFAVVIIVMAWALRRLQARKWI